MREAFALRDQSVAWQLASIHNRVAAGVPIEVSGLQPAGIEPLLRHLRLPNRLRAGQLASLLKRSATELLAEMPLEEAFARLSCLPVTLPASFRKAFKKLPAEQRIRFIEDLRQRHPSPLSMLHLFGLLDTSLPDERHVAEEILTTLAHAGAVPEWNVYLRLLRWSYDWLVVTEAAAALGNPALIAASWVHASRLYSAVWGTNTPTVLENFLRVTPPRWPFWDSRKNCMDLQTWRTLTAPPARGFSL